jgi:hypothetical protein
MVVEDHQVLSEHSVPMGLCDCNRHSLRLLTRHGVPLRGLRHQVSRRATRRPPYTPVSSNGPEIHAKQGPTPLPH